MSNISLRMVYDIRYKNAVVHGCRWYKQNVPQREQILKFLMLCTALISRGFSPYNGAQSQFHIHILMNREGRKFDAIACQINPHPAISGNAVGFMIYGLNLMQDILFSGNFFCPSVLSVVIISIWINFQMSQQPPNTKQIPIFVYEPIGL